MILTSTGPSAERQGDGLGVFDYLQQHNDSPAYIQRHSVANTQPYFLYRDDSGDWCVSVVLGSSSCFLRNKTQSDSVPCNNWQYFGFGGWKSRWKGRWKSDPEMTASTSLPSVCPVINISLHGAAARAQPRAGGEYRPTGEWSAGHPVFSNGDLYLCVRPGLTGWSVRDSPDNLGAKLVSGCVTWCPTSPRAALSHRDSQYFDYDTLAWQRDNQRSWQYFDYDTLGWQEGDILVFSSDS